MKCTNMQYGLVFKCILLIAPIDKKSREDNEVNYSGRKYAHIAEMCSTF